MELELRASIHLSKVAYLRWAQFFKVGSQIGLLKKRQHASLHLVAGICARTSLHILRAVKYAVGPAKSSMGHLFTALSSAARHRLDARDSK